MANRTGCNFLELQEILDRKRPIEEPFLLVPSILSGHNGQLIAGKELKVSLKAGSKDPAFLLGLIF